VSTCRNILCCRKHVRRHEYMNAVTLPAPKWPAAIEAKISTGCHRIRAAAQAKAWVVLINVLRRAQGPWHKARQWLLRPGSKSLPLAPRKKWPEPEQGKAFVSFLGVTVPGACEPESLSPAGCSGSRARTRKGRALQASKAKAAESGRQQGVASNSTLNRTRNGKPPWPRGAVCISCAARPGRLAAACRLAPR